MSIGDIRYHTIGPLILGLLFLPTLLTAQQQDEPVTRMTFETHHQGTGAFRSYQLDSLDVELDGAILTVTGYMLSGREDPKYQTMILKFANFTGRGSYSISGDRATWQNLNSGDGYCHSLSGTAEITAWEPGVTVEGTFRFLCESTPRVGDPFNTIIEGEFVSGLEGKFLSPVEGDEIGRNAEQLITWQLPGRANIDLYYTLEKDPENPEAETYVIVEDIDSKDGEFLWTTPDTISPYLWIIAVDREGIAPHVFSDSLRIRTPLLARLRTDPDGPCPTCPYYETYHPGRHGWQHRNGSDSVFAPDSYNGRNPYYGGIDPLTNLPYPSFFLEPPITAQPADYPDWTNWVGAFTQEASYDGPGRDTAFPRPDRAAVWARAKEPYNGSCFGMAVTSAYAFYFPEDFASRFPEAIRGTEHAENPYRVSASQEYNDLISRFHAYQFGRAYTYQWRGLGRSMRPMETVEWLRDVLLSDEVDPHSQQSPVVTIASDGPNGGAHALLAYEIEEVEDDPEIRVYVYDPNAPGNSELYIAVNRETNTWSYGPLGWSGSLDFAAPDFITHYREPAGYLDEEEASFTPVTFAARGMSISAQSVGGAFSWSATEGYSGTDPDASPLYAVTGPGEPYGYFVGERGYDIDATAVDGSGISIGFLGRDLIFNYGSDADDGQTDNVRWDDRSLTIHNPGSSARTIYVEAIMSLEGMTRTFDVSNLALGGGDSIRFEILEDDLVIENHGEATSYDVTLRQTGAEGFLEGEYDPVDLDAGDGHRIDPPWWNFGTRLPIYVTDGDGGVKDTIIRINSLLGVDREDGLIRGLNLTNPLPDLGTLDLHLGRSGELRVEAYDPLGRRAGLLYRGEVLHGDLSLPIDARSLPPGHYILTLSLNGERVGSVQVVRVR